MSDIAPQGELKTFWQLLQEGGIEIPRIQRDYAQGRDSQSKLLKTFLDALCGAIKDKAPLVLDFVYGVTKNAADEKKSMQPIDGQQRLSTLFLLHWYALSKDQANDEMPLLRKFSYETRSHSRDFCRGLAANPVPLQDANDCELSECVKNAAWFLSPWEDDPTVTGMLRSLDAIHKTFMNIENLRDSLINGRLISFYYLELKDFGLSDDLYIRMNARGKSLTSFEIFKALFEERIEKEEWEKDIHEEPDRFAHKADTIWTDLFWKLIMRDGRDPSDLDKVYMNCMATVAMCMHALSRDEHGKERITTLHEAPDALEPGDFDESGYNMLKDTFSAYCENGNDVLSCKTIAGTKRGLSTFWHLWDYEEPLFSILLKQNPTYEQRALFYAQTQYLIRNKNRIDDNFYYWMRVGRNIIHEALREGESSERFIGVIQLLTELVEKGKGNIYRFLATNAEKELESKFRQEHMKHERHKAIILEKGKLKNTWNNIIFQLEDADYFKGDIGFALYCYPDNNGTIDNAKLEKIKKCFEGDILYKNKGEQSFYIRDEFRRALLTISDNDFYEYWGTWSYKFKTMHYRLISNVDDLHNFIKHEDDYCDYLKDLVKKRIEGSKPFSKIIDDFTKSAKFKKIDKWKQILIRDKKWLSDNRCHVFPDAIVAEKKKIFAILQWGKRPGSQNYDFYPRDPQIS